MAQRVPPLDRAGFPLAVLMTILLVSAVTDIILDQPASLLSWHMVVELTMVITALATTAFLWYGWARTETSLEQVSDSLEKVSDSLGRQSLERDSWRARAQSLLRGLGEEIDLQLTEWGLTPTEREVALMLLKGLSLKEIARVTDRSERTVRQHAIAVYRKSGVGGRAELSAFFLEDLLPPPAPEVEARGSEASAHA